MSYDMIAVIRASNARRKKVLAMRRRLMSFEMIAEQIGVSKQRAYAIWREATRAEKKK